MSDGDRCTDGSLFSLVNTFVSSQGPELLSKWLGESEKALQGLFKKARAAGKWRGGRILKSTNRILTRLCCRPTSNHHTAPTVIFFDEVDALAGRRGAGEDSKASERVLSQLLTGAVPSFVRHGGFSVCATQSVTHQSTHSCGTTELDGVQPLRRVVVVAATNRPDLLDPALMRPGRIDRKVYVPPPELASRREILTIATRGVPLDGDLDLDAVARYVTRVVG